MTERDLWRLFDAGDGEPVPVTVTARDYVYEGWLVAVFTKRSGEVRCTVEDENRRLFIHNASQIRKQS